MKRFIVCLAALLILSMSIAPAYAAEGESVETSSNVYVTVEDNTPVEVLSVDDNTATRSQLTSALIDIFGEYTPRTQTVTTYFADGSSVQSVEVVPGIAGLDWVWISGVFLFALFLYCLMRLLGGAVK